MLQRGVGMITAVPDMDYMGHVRWPSTCRCCCDMHGVVLNIRDMSRQPMGWQCLAALEVEEVAAKQL